MGQLLPTEKLLLPTGQIVAVSPVSGVPPLVQYRLKHAAPKGIAVTVPLGNLAHNCMVCAEVTGSVYIKSIPMVLAEQVVGVVA